MIRVSRQKIYDSIATAEKKYGSFDGMTIFASYTKPMGLKLNFWTKDWTARGAPIPQSINVTYCFRHTSRFEITEQVAEAIEVWLNDNINKK